MMLELRRVTKNFGGLQALADISVTFRPHEFIGLIGPNGSGKTTLLNCVSGLYRPDSGSIRLEDQVISKYSAHRICRMGIGRTFQISKVFSRLSVFDNLRIPALAEKKMSGERIAERARAILQEIKLDRLGRSAAQSLSGGQKKLLEVGMIMMTDPRVLLLDEPFGGVHPELKSQLEEYLCRLNRAGKTIILVSHEMASVFRICRRLVVLDRGVLITDGSAETVRSDERVIKAYLGGRHET
jgi:branched-chain amino acid transport system ATP-binding protein